MQEEPKNSGAWRYLLEPLMQLVERAQAEPQAEVRGPPREREPRYWFPLFARYEQKLLVDEALSS